MNFKQSKFNILLSSKKADYFIYCQFLLFPDSTKNFISKLKRLEKSTQKAEA